MTADSLVDARRFAPTEPDKFKELPPALQEHMLRAAELLTFDYSPEQWAEVAKSLQPLKAKDEAIEKARGRLERAARSFFRDKLNGPGHKRQRQWKLEHWTKVDKLADALISEFFWLERDEIRHGPPDPSGKERQPYRHQITELMKISVKAKRHVSPNRIDDGFPRTTLKSDYHGAVLRVWTELGGKLKVSRHPATGKIKGPLVRYFSAVTQPVHGGSPESLPDIIRRHVELEAAIEKWRLDMFVANHVP
jgi:hypothetical protein